MRVALKSSHVRIAILGLFLLQFPFETDAQSAYGPPNGALIIVGGGPAGPEDEIMRKFVELGGGPENGRFVIVPTAGGNRDAEGNLIEYLDIEVVRPFVERTGARNVRMLHTADALEADTDAFVEPLLDATAIWFEGGRQWNIVDSYANTRTLAEFHKVLERGGVIGGTSAGATIQGEYLVRGDTSGPNVVMTEEPNHQNGFAFLKRSAIDQHINTRDRWDDLIPVIERFPNLLGIGLSERTAIIVTGDRFEVMGAWKVAVHDNTRPYQPWEKPYFVLSAGDVYDMNTRSIVSLGSGTGCAAPPRPNGSYSVSPDILETYTGDYQTRPTSQVASVIREQSGLFLEMMGGRGELLPLSDNDFFLNELGAQVRFDQDQAGQVTHIVIRQNCRDARIPRVAE